MMTKLCDSCTFMMCPDHYSEEEYVGFLPVIDRTYVGHGVYRENYTGREVKVKFSRKAIVKISLTFASFALGGTFLTLALVDKENWSLAAKITLLVVGATGLLIAITCCFRFYVFRCENKDSEALPLLGFTATR